jgi:2-keto-3-deoxy-L-fuconate dehydrogenase
VARQPIGRLGTAEEVAAAICYLASPAAGYTTGTALQIDGGTHSVVVPRA